MDKRPYYMFSSLFLLRLKFSADIFIYMMGTRLIMEPLAFFLFSDAKLLLISIEYLTTVHPAIKSPIIPANSSIYTILGGC